MICPRCSVAEIVPASGACALCGFMPDGNVAVETPHPDATDHLARQELAHEFRIDVLLGQGTHSTVYLVREGRSSEYKVLKVLLRPKDRDDPQADERFRRAVETLITLDHPHIVPVHRFGSTDSLFWYTMDHVRARSLREILRSRGRLELKMCQRLVSQIASALDYAHRRGVVHGALKPENVLIDPNGWVHLCDPLVTRAIERPAPPARRTEPKRAEPRRSGTRPVDEDLPGDEAETPPPARRPDYTAPEDRPGMAGLPLSDQYALGVLVHECLTGVLPSAGSDAFEPPASLEVLRPDLPAHVTHAVRRAMSLKSSDRYPSILDFVMALETGVLPLTDSRPLGRASEVLLVTGWKPPAATLGRQILVKGLVVIGLIGTVAMLWGPVQRWREKRSFDRQSEFVTPPNDRVPPPVTDSAPAAAPDVAPAASAARPVGGTAPRRTESRNRSPGMSTIRSRTPAATAPAAAAAPAAEPGKLFVNATPWGQVLIDGTSVGNTPKANLSVTPGSHTIRVVREGYETWERTVQVGSGEVVRLTDIVLTARP